MPCCKAEIYEWCKDLPVVYKDDKEYCVFHAPQGKKDISVEAFNKLIFEKINEAIKSNTKCILDGTVFEGYISFSQFNKDNPLPEISFYDAIFNRNTDFVEATFSENVDFRGAKFNEMELFLRVTFKGNANFMCTRFSKVVVFSKTIFNGTAFFALTKFSEGTSFSETIFNGNANFVHTIFNKETDFFKTTFNSETIFGRTTFRKEVGFSETIFRKKAAFTALTLVEKMKFVKINLSVQSFIDTDLTKIDFINCEWHKYHGRNVLYDEICLFKNKEETQKNKKTEGILLRLKKILKQEWLGFLKDISCDKKQIKKVEILYRQLKRKCKEDHNELDISDWHYGEKEMYRKENRFRRFFPLSLAHLYWLSSGYGERPKRAGIVLICLILLVSVLFGFAGLIPNSEPRLAPINEIRDLVKNPFEVLVNTLQYATFEKDTYFIPQNIWGTFLKILAKLFIPLQAALFAFSVRNRFRR